jgi:hypothetical protein
MAQWRRMVRRRLLECVRVGGRLEKARYSGRISYSVIYTMNIMRQKMVSGRDSGIWGKGNVIIMPSLAMQSHDPKASCLMSNMIIKNNGREEWEKGRCDGKNEI